MTHHTWTPIKIAWISGVAAIGSCALTDSQRAFMGALPGPEGSTLESNFPYAGRTSSENAPSGAPIAVAGAISAVRFLIACQPLRRRSRLEAWTRLKASCDRLFLISLSCGSQIAWSMERARPEGAEVRMLSLGPVDFGCGSIHRTSLVGTDDRVSRSPNLDGARRIHGVGHLDYAGSSAVRAAAAEWLDLQLRQQQVAP